MSKKKDEAPVLWLDRGRKFIRERLESDRLKYLAFWLTLSARDQERVPEPWRTILDEVLEVRPDFIEHQLAHVVRDPNGRAYNRTAHLEARRKMMQTWADYLDGLKG